MRTGIEQLEEVHLSHDEACFIKDAIGRLQSALAWYGYSPR
ncbi:DUF7706 family protein [Xenorhabdus doucetiae]|nr:MULTISPECIES: hypothetical protein [unclassified Xenorhabdus]